MKPVSRNIVRAFAPVSGVGCRIHSGDAARTIVFLHGIGSHGASFASLFEIWPAGPRLIAWDAPGYGGSKPLADAWPAAADYAAKLDAMLDPGDYPAVDLVGHSLGCLVAGAFARAYPQRVRRLALLSPALGYRIAAGGMLPPAVASRITDLATLGAARFAETRAPRLVHRPESKPEIVTMVRDAMQQIRPEGYAQAVHMLASGDLIADVAKIAAPILILNGADDSVTPPAGAEKLVAVCQKRTERSASLEIIPECGHAIYQEAPALVASRLNRFFEGAA